MALAPRARIMADVATEVIKNLSMRIPPIRVWGSRRRRTAGDLSDITSHGLEELVFASLEALTDAIPRERLKGTTVIEIGPGENLVFGLVFVALGVGKYHAIDPFMGNVSGERARRLYAAVSRELPLRFGVPASAVPDFQTFPGDLLGDKVFLHRQGIERFHSMGLAEKADLVFSKGVGQSAAFPEAFALATAYFLKPGGVGIHSIQFGPLGCWTRYRNPLTFLTVPQWVWPWTSSHRGSANRARYHEFIELFGGAGLNVETEILEEFGPAELEEARPHLDRRFGLAPSDSLRVRFAKFVCLKPGQECQGKENST
jgi:hypothetical protein